MIAKGLDDVSCTFAAASPWKPNASAMLAPFKSVLSKPHCVSLPARPFQTKSGNAINRLQLGLVSAADMLHAADAQNILWTWASRLVEFVLMSVGIGMVLHPLAAFGDVIPFIGDVIRLGAGLVAAGTRLML